MERDIERTIARQLFTRTEDRSGGSVERGTERTTFLLWQKEAGWSGGSTESAPTYPMAVGSVVNNNNEGETRCIYKNEPNHLMNRYTK